MLLNQVLYVALNLIEKKRIEIDIKLLGLATNVEIWKRIEINHLLQVVRYYQGFVSFINESIMEDSQALIPPDTHKLGYSQKPVRKKSGKPKTFGENTPPASLLDMCDHTCQAWWVPSHWTLSTDPSG